MVLLLLRHGSHDRLDRVLCGRMAGVTLGPAGQAQAQALAEGLRGEILAAVYASPLERARQTAEPVAALAGVPVDIDEDLNEIDVGAWSGAGFDALDRDPAWDAWNLRRDLSRPPGGETMLEAQGRVVRCVERLARKHADATVAAVSHADLIKAALAWGLGLPLGQLSRFEVAPASVSRLMVGPWGAKVWSINESFKP